MARKWWTLTVVLAGMFMLGFVSFSTALAALVYGLISAGGGWGSAKVIASLGAAAGLLAAFVLIEAAQRQPMLDLSLFRVPTFTGGLLAAFGISASLFSLLTYIILYLQDDLGFSALGTGLRVLFLTVPVFVAVGIAGRLTTVVPVRPMIALGAIFAGQFLSIVTRRLVGAPLAAHAHAIAAAPGSDADADRTQLTVAATVTS